MAKKSKTTTVVAPNYAVTYVEPVLVKTPAEMRASGVMPRKLRDHDYRYTVDELLSLMVLCGDNQILLYDTCDMSEYRYYKTSLVKYDVQLLVEKETHMGDIFELFVLDPRRNATCELFSTYEDRYWATIVPAGDLLAAARSKWEDGGKSLDGWEYARTRLNLAIDSCTFTPDTCTNMVLPLVHALPYAGVSDWLKFVGRKFSDIQQDTENKHVPFCTEFMY